MAESKKHYFYVLHTKDDTFYGGYTTDPVRRLKEHNDGIGAKYTKLPKRRPLTMIHLEEFETRSEATSAEYQFKHIGTRKKKESYLLDTKAESDSLLNSFFKTKETGTKGLHSSENPNNNSKGPDLAKENHLV